MHIHAKNYTIMLQNCRPLWDNCTLLMQYSLKCLQLSVVVAESGGAIYYTIGIELVVLAYVG